MISCGLGKIHSLTVQQCFLESYMFQTHLGVWDVVAMMLAETLPSRISHS